MSSIRIQKVGDLIRDELAARLPDEVDEARQALVTVTSVSLTADMRLARVLVSIFPASADRTAILAALNRARGRLRRDLGKRLRLRVVPELQFKLDDSAEQRDKIDRILRSGPDDAGGGSDPERRE
jgi:ribosome-binding factor A